MSKKKFVLRLIDDINFYETVYDNWFMKIYSFECNACEELNGLRDKSLRLAWENKRLKMMVFDLMTHQQLASELLTKISRYF